MLNQSKKDTRISSIDALRAFALLGILITHTIQLFNFNNSYNDISFLSSSTTTLYKYMAFIFNGRFKIIFSILFGVSFYLILRNPFYSSKKFLWRLTLLLGFGLLNKLFYTTEILMWYGLCGMLLILFRGIPTKRLIIWLIISYVLFLFLRASDYAIINFSKTDYSIRYQIIYQFRDIVSYPLYNSIHDYLSMILPYGVFETLSYFLLGYILGKSGIIFKLDKYCRIINIFIISIIYIIMIILYRVEYYVVLKCINEFIGAILYSTIFIFLYNKQSKYFKVLENYGKCGLTNYTLQNIFGVSIVYYIIFPYKLNGLLIFLLTISLYSIQVILSNLWMSRHTYGPLESLWRRLTNYVN